MNNLPDKTARCILSSDRGYLLVQHSNCSVANRGKWGLPGGRLEHGEAARGTLARELMEELFIEVESFVEVGRYLTRDRWHRIFASSFHGEVDSFDPEEIAAVRWFSGAEVDGLEQRNLLHNGFEGKAIRDLVAAVGRRGEQTVFPRANR